MALAGYFAAVGWLTVQDLQSKLLSAAAIWGASVLVLLFYLREALEIEKLSIIIRTRIAEPAAKTLDPSATTVRAEDLIPSEFHADQSDPTTQRMRRTARFYDIVFMCSVFLIIPAVCSMYHIKAEAFSDAWSSIFIVVEGLSVAALLFWYYKRH